MIMLFCNILERNSFFFTQKHNLPRMKPVSDFTATCSMFE